MKIGTLRKTSLVDYPGLVASVIFLRGCNLRCPYCYNGALLTGAGDGEGFVTLEELFSHLKKRAKVEQALVVSGGEALLHPNTPQIIEYAHSLGLLVKLDTNGTLPDRLASLIANKATAPNFIALDFKTSPTRYNELQGNKCALVTNVAKNAKSDENGFESSSGINKNFVTQQDATNKSKKLANNGFENSSKTDTNPFEQNKSLINSLQSNFQKTNFGEDSPIAKNILNFQPFENATSAKNSPITKTLKIISDNYSPDCYEVRTVLVPKLVELSDIAQIDASIPCECLWALSRFISGSCLCEDYNKLQPYTHAQIDELVSAAKALHKNVILR